MAVVVVGGGAAVDLIPPANHLAAVQVDMGRVDAGVQDGNHHVCGGV